MITMLEIGGLADPIEIRAEPGVDGAPARLYATGTAIRYGALSKNMGGFVERIMRGAPDAAMENRNIAAYHEHPDPTPGRGYQGMHRLLGTTEAGTLTLRNSASSLDYEINLPDTSAGRDAAVLLERGDLRGSSYGYFSDKATERWTKGKDGLALRSVHNFKVFDHIALTASAAYPTSTSELVLRSFAEHHGLEVRAVLAAAEARELGDMIDAVADRLEGDPPPADETSVDDDDEQPPGDSPPAPPPAFLQRERITSLYL